LSGWELRREYGNYFNNKEIKNKYVNAEKKQKMLKNYIYNN